MRARSSTPVRFAWLVAVGVALVAAAPARVAAQPKHTGQNVQPIYEGWTRNADGSFTMNFGYLNRNYTEHVIAPLGADNKVEPEGPDRGQPAYFYPRMHRFAFSVVVPKDWGRKEVIWTVTTNGKTDQAVGWLQPEWELDRKNALSITGRASIFDDDALIEKNRPPSVKVAGAPKTAIVGQPVTLTVSATDDDKLPPPEPPRGQLRVAGQETPPTLLANTIDSPVNVPIGPNRPPLPPRGRVTARWVVYRGPANAAFTPGEWQDVKGGQAAASVRFTVPGDYVLRVTASDGMDTSTDDVRITVAAKP